MKHAAHHPRPNSNKLVLMVLPGCFLPLECMLVESTDQVCRVVTASEIYNHTRIRF